MSRRSLRRIYVTLSAVWAVAALFVAVRGRPRPYFAIFDQIALPAPAARTPAIFDQIEPPAKPSYPDIFDAIDPSSMEANAPGVPKPPLPEALKLSTELRPKAAQPPAEQFDWPSAQIVPAPREYWLREAAIIVVPPTAGYLFLFLALPMVVRFRPTAITFSPGARIGVVLAIAWLLAERGYEGTFTRRSTMRFDSFWWNVGLSFDPTHGWLVVPITCAILIALPMVVEWAIRPIVAGFKRYDGHR